MAAVMPSMPPKRGRSGVGWLVFLAIPPVVIVAGLVAMFAWEGSRGGVTPKWKKPSPAQPAVAGTNGAGAVVREEAR